MCDGCCKCAHFASAGRSQGMADNPPRTCSHLGPGAHKVLRQYRDGELTSAAQQRYACAAADGSGSGDDEASPPVSCSSNLTCSRASASARGTVDFAGCACVACAHGIVLHDGVVGMPTPEQHAFHFAGMTAALLRRPDIVDFYVDIACRLEEGLRVHLHNAKMDDGRPLLRPETIEKVRGNGLGGCTAA